jgi:hypothetical protein
MSYKGSVRSLRARSRRGLLGLGATPDDVQLPVVVPSSAQSSPILSTASVMASGIMLRMASVPRSKRLGEMVSILNAAQAGFGDQAKQQFLQLSSQRPSNMMDQTMFDVISASVANMLAARTLAARRPGVSGLGQTVAEVQGRTSAGVNDANALFCSYGAGTTGLVSGLLAQFNTGGSSSTAGITGAQAGGQIAGCGAGQLALQAQTAQAQAQAAQSAGVQQLQMQQHQEQMTFQYLLLGGGGLVIATILYAVLKK